MKIFSKKLMAIILAVAMLVGVMSVPSLANPGGNVTVIVSFEGFNLGHGFYAPPTEVTVPAGSEAIDAARAALNLLGIQYFVDWGELNRIYGVNPNWNLPPNPPPYLAGRPFGPHEGPAYSIGAGDYWIAGRTQLQWRVTVNHHLRNQFFGLGDGDVVRFMMSNSLGWPYGEDDLGLPPEYHTRHASAVAERLYVHANKTELIRALFAGGVDPAARQAALDVIINPLATPQQVTDTLAALQDSGGGEEIAVIISFEGYNLGHGFYVEPTQVTVPAGSSVRDATRTFIGQLGNITHSEHWGLNRLYGVHPGTAGTPQSFHTVTFGTGPTDGSLGDSDYTSQAGWFHTINHFDPGAGWEDSILTDGAVVRWKFSVEGWGADLGITQEFGGWGTPLYEHMDKTVLIRTLLSTANTPQAVRQHALDVIINPLATSAQVAAAIVALETGELPGGNFIPGDINGDGVVNDLDLMALRLYLLGIDDNVVNVGALDVNGDGVVNDLDVMALRMILLGL